ncbi:hypothetical protein [Celerinatantimonas sp. MCCC 1A17872]|uniref:hypothetical protein n=1 Tax=Celerinatantimonas sp. MCCC 1A17872 TaxID=3177514 RepID=UPI0038C07D3F
MPQLEQILTEWLSNKLSDSEYYKYLIDHCSECESRFTRGKFLQLKHFNRVVAREILDELAPCDFCNKEFTIEKLFSLRDNPNFELINKPDFVNISFPYSGVMGPEQYARCKKCGSILLFIAPEREFKGWWGKVG